MSADLDHSGDYGYDLVQEVKASLQVPSPRRRPPVGGAAATGRQLDGGDPGGDLGYDLVDSR